MPDGVYGGGSGGVRGGGSAGVPGGVPDAVSDDVYGGGSDGTSYAGGTARPWLAADARGWRAAGPRAAWVRPTLPAVVLLVAVFAAVLMSPDPTCTPQAPCGEEWVDKTGTMLFLPHLVCLFFLPELAVLTAPLLLLYLARPGQWEGGAGEKVAAAVVVAALCWGWLAVAQRLRARRRQRALIAEAAGGVTASAPMPDGIEPGQRGLFRRVAGLLMCAVGAALIVTVVVQDRADDRTARVAVARDVPVVAYNPDDYLLTVRMPDGSRHRFDVDGDYRDVGTVTVLLHGDWVRLAGEPYPDDLSHFLRQAGGMALVGLGLASALSGQLARRRVVALRRGPVPVLRARARTRADGFTEIYGADGLGSEAVLHYEPFPHARSGVHDVLLYGALSEDGALVLTSAESGPAAKPSVEVSLSPIRGGPAVDHGDAGSTAGRRDAGHRQAAEIDVQRALGTVVAAAGPVRWHAGPVARCVGAVMLVTGAGAVTSAAVGGWPWSRVLWFSFVALTWFYGGWRLMTWQITADSVGLRVRGLLSSRARHIPWDAVGHARYGRGGALTITCVEADPEGSGAPGGSDEVSGAPGGFDEVSGAPGGSEGSGAPGGPGRHRGLGGSEEISLGVVGWPFAERLLKRPGRAAVAAAEITAMIRQPGLRPGPPEHLP
ncbi:hypothetical protein [Streptomyces sp. NPDC088910]|uniref:hypothetical protein n=1 Tax=Streptomyces sp. NPDC088910 TaxID=3365911 RepID=UPI0038108064